MWPTFYIPLALQADDFISIGAYEVCGHTSSGTSITIPTPTEIEDGDIQVVVLEYVISVGLSPVYPDVADPEWKRAFESDVEATGGYGDSRQTIFWRTWHTGDAAFSLGISGGGGGITAAYTSVALTRPNTADPWFSTYTYLYLKDNNPSAIKDSYGSSCTLMEISSSGDLVVFVSAPRYGVSATGEPAGSAVTFACTESVIAPGSGGNGHTIAGVEARVNGVNNLLTYCPSLDPAGWTNVGLTRTAPSPGISVDAVSYVRLTSSGTSRHYMEQEVTLEAGKTYMFAAAYRSFSEVNPSPYFWLTYVKPDNTEHGVGAWGTNSITFTSSTEVVWNGAGSPSLNEQIGLSYSIGGNLSYLITPSATGTYKMRVHVTYGPFGMHPGYQPDDPLAPSNGNQWADIAGVVLQEGPATQQQPCFLPTTSAPILPGDEAGVIVPEPNSENTAGVYLGYTMLVLRRSGGSRPPCRLFSPGTRNRSLEFSDYAIVDTRERHDEAITGYMALGASHVVYEHLAGKKYYCELYVNSFGTGAANDAYSIGVCLAGAMQDIGVATKIGDWPGQYSYMSTGKTWTNGTQDGGSVATWSPGDYIGVGIDFTNWEVTFYRNGSLVKTQNIASNYNRYGLWRAQFGVRGDITASKQARFTYNFAGSFGGRKPTGFLAYDFDNEVP
jgi:hypothetical protein